MLAHMTNANVLFNYLKTVLKREVIVRKDLHLKRSDFEGIDLVVSVGKVISHFKLCVAYLLYLIF
jgi:hypothetical protein